jgi:hypothetical protein
MSRFSRPAAYHEAGHAVACLALGSTVNKIEVCDVAGRGSTGTLTGWCDREIPPCWSVEKEVVAILAGPVAEARYTKRSLPSRLPVRHEDGDGAYLLRLLSVIPGEPDRLRTIRLCAVESKVIISRWWPEVRALAAKLARRGHVMAPTLHPSQPNRQRGDDHTRLRLLRALAGRHPQTFDGGEHLALILGW